MLTSYEKLLIFRSLGMILYVLKHFVVLSKIQESYKRRILERINSLIKEVTDHVNELLVSIK